MNDTEEVIRTQALSLCPNCEHSLTDYHQAATHVITDDLWIECTHPECMDVADSRCIDFGRK